MARSLKKGPFVALSLEKKVLKNVEENKKTVIKTWSRASLITPDFVGQMIQPIKGFSFYECTVIKFLDLICCLSVFILTP